MHVSYFDKEYNTGAILIQKIFRGLNMFYKNFLI